VLLLCPRAISLSVVHYIRRDLPRGSLQKPAIEGHFKTGQRTLTLDGLVLPYRTAVGNSNLIQSGRYHQTISPAFCRT
jgi:hypothetical protein